MKTPTPDTLQLPLAIGLESDEDHTQLINGDGWDLGEIRHHPHGEIAAFIVHAVNLHKRLVEALEDMTEQARIAVQRLNAALGADAQIPGNAPFVLNDNAARATLNEAKGGF